MTITIKKIEDITEAQRLWDLLSPKESIFDTWEFRYIFYKYTRQPIAFYTGYDGDTPIGLLPLQINEQTKQLEFFGGNFMDDNTLFLLPGYESSAELFFSSLPVPTTLSYIAGTNAFTSQLPIIDYHFIAPIDTVTTTDEYLHKLVSSDKRREIQRRARKMLSEHSIVVYTNKLDDLELLFSLNKEQFGEKSTFYYPNRETIYKDLTQAEMFHPALLTIELDGQKAAVFLSLTYKETYIAINGGISASAPKDFHTYTKVAKLEEALQYKAKKYDALTNDCGWKENWGFQKIPQRIYTNVSAE